MSAVLQTRTRPMLAELVVANVVGRQSRLQQRPDRRIDGGRRTGQVRAHVLVTPAHARSGDLVNQAAGEMESWMITRCRLGDRFVGQRNRNRKLLAAALDEIH